MPLRKMKQKKYNGIYEYYRTTDMNHTTIAYYINFRNEYGNPTKEKTDAKSPDEATVILKRKKYEISQLKKQFRDKETVIYQNNITLNQLSEQFFEQRTTINNAKDGRVYKTHIQPVLGSKKISNMKKADIMNLQTLLLKKELANKTINLITDLFNRIMNFAIETEYTLINPVKSYKKLEVNNIVMRVFTPEEVQQLFEDTIHDIQLQFFMKMLYYTGQRPASILRLQKKHITNSHISIKPIKKQDWHHVPIAIKLKDYLTDWIADFRPDEYLFHPLKNRSKPITYNALQMRAQEVFKKYNDGLDKDKDRLQWASLYTLRHSAATNLLKSTGNERLVQSVLNHSDSRMTQRYAKLANDTLADGLNTL